MGNLVPEGIESTMPSSAKHASSESTEAYLRQPVPPFPLTDNGWVTIWIVALLDPAGGATVVEFNVEVPGTYTLVDHAIFRVEKGAVGFLEVEGDPRHDIYLSKDGEEVCEGCLVQP